VPELGGGEQLMSPRIVTENVTFLWDGVTQRLPKGQVMDVPPGSALEAAIGLHRLVPYGAPAPQPPVEETPAVKPAEAVPQEETPVAVPRPRTPAKSTGTSKDGDA
jgi:hypothetical protein